MPEDQSEAIIKLAVESGINVFDISEAHSGKFLTFPWNHYPNRKFFLI